MKQICLGLLLILCSYNLSFAEENNFSYKGFLQANTYYYPLQAEKFAPEGILNLKFKVSLSGNWQLISELEARYNYLELERQIIIEDQDYRPYFSLEEFYFKYNWADIDLSFGVRKINWGVTDRFNPLDLINPIDLTDIIYDRKIGLPIVTLSYYTGDWEFEFVFAPYFVPSRLPPENSYFYTGTDLPSENELPEFSLTNVQLGLLVSWQHKGLELLGMAYYGYDHLPFIDLEILSPLAMQLVYDYQRMAAFGCGFEYAIKKFVFRGEGAYYHYPELSQEDYGQYVVGLDYNFGQVVGKYNLYLTIQYIGESPEIEDDFWVRHLFTNAASAKLLLGNDFFKISLEGIYNFPNHGTIIIPSIAYTFKNNLSVELQYNYFAGQENSYWHFNQQNERYIFILKYTF